MLALQERTEGWPAALQLAAISLAGAPRAERWVERFSGSQGAVASISRRTCSRACRRESATSSCAQVCCRSSGAELCDFVLEIDYSRRLIEKVQNHNLFLIARCRAGLVPVSRIVR